MKILFEENVLNKNPKFYIILSFPGELAQLARASALQAEGQGFEPPILHKKPSISEGFFVFPS